MVADTREPKEIETLISRPKDFDIDTAVGGKESDEEIGYAGNVAEWETVVDPEDIGGAERIIDPFDPTLIRVDTRPMTIDLLLSRIRHDKLDLTPGFQRKSGIWNDGVKSRLIESLLISVPLPAFYMDASDDNRWIVVDGQQRLITLKKFAIDKTLRLRELEFLVNLLGKTYDELPRNLQRRIVETQVTVYLIHEGTPREVKFNVFKRINTGGLPLSAQEIRHALNQGKATDLLSRLADSDEFKEAIDKGIRDDRMGDRECVLRCLAFTITPYTAYRVKDMDNFLNNSMAEMNNMSDQKVEELEDQFRRTMVIAFEIFGKDAFRKLYETATGKGRYPINKALFEAWSVNLVHLSDKELQVLKERKGALKEGFINLMGDRMFDESISQGTGDPSKVKYRFSAIEQLIKGVLS